jgi:hypothetical protein
MITGICRLEMILYDSSSLKDKRRILKGLVERLRSKYNVSVAEVDHNDKWQAASIGISTVSNSTAQVNRVLDSVIKFIERDGRVEITGYHIDMI